MFHHIRASFSKIIKFEYSGFLFTSSIVPPRIGYTVKSSKNRRDGVVVRASASQSVDLGFIS